MAAALKGVDVVVDLASSSNPGLGDVRLERDIQDNLLPHVRLIEAVQAAGVQRLVFVSSGGAVYGTPQYKPIDEAHPTNPISSYGIVKLSIEKYLAMFGVLHDLDYVILRVSNPFGPGQIVKKGQGLVPAILRAIVESEPLTVFGDGRAQRDYIYIEDLIDALEKAILLPGASRKVINIGSGEGRSICDIVAKIEEVSGRRPELRFRSPAAERRGRQYSGVRLAQIRFSAGRPAWEFSEAIAKTVGAFFRTQPQETLRTQRDA